MNNFYAAEAERSLIGCALLDPNCFKKIAGIVESSDLFLDENRKIFDAIERIFNQKKPIDLVSVSSELHRLGELNSIGGPERLADIQNEVPLSIHWETYTKIVKNVSTLRSLDRFSDELKNRVSSDVNTPVEEIIAQALTDLKNKSNASVTQRSMGQVWEKYCEMQDRKGLSTGNPIIDGATKGLTDNCLMTINAFSGTGKTTMSMQMARNFMNQSKKVIFYSLEMEDYQVMGIIDRIMQHKKDSIDKLMYDWSGRLEIVNRLYSWNKIELHALNQEPDIIIVDYAQIIEIDGRNSVERLEKLGKRVMQFCRDTNTICIMLSQISLASANGDNQFISSKGGNGLLEASDVFVTLNRDFAAEKETLKSFYANQEGFKQDPVFERNLVVAKNRLGMPKSDISRYDFRDGKGLYLDF